MYYVYIAAQNTLKFLRYIDVFAWRLLDRLKLFNWWKFRNEIVA